jgi:hypothetical protein
VAYRYCRLYGRQRRLRVNYRQTKMSAEMGAFSKTRHRGLCRTTIADFAALRRLRSPSAGPDRLAKPAPRLSGTCSKRGRAFAAGASATAARLVGRRPPRRGDDPHRSPKRNVLLKIAASRANSTSTVCPGLKSLRASAKALRLDVLTPRTKSRSPGLIPAFSAPELGCTLRTPDADDPGILTFRWT